SLARPKPTFEQQEQRFRRAFELLEEATANHAFPAASVAVTYRGELVARKGIGHFTFESSSPAVVPETIFDLASVTKVIATTSMAMVLYERGLLDLDMTVASIVPEFLSGDSRRDEITLRMLLSHASGLPAYEKLFQRARNRAELLKASLAVPLIAEPGER